MADWTAPAFIDALKTAVAARADIQAMTSPKVTVLDYDPGIDVDTGDLLVIGYRITDSNEPATFRDDYMETVDVQCYLRVMRLEAASNDGTAAKSARDRAADILGAVDNTLRTNDYTDPGSVLSVGDQTIIAWVSGREQTTLPYFDGNGSPIQMVENKFTVRYEAHTSASSS